VTFLIARAFTWSALNDSKFINANKYVNALIINKNTRVEETKCVNDNYFSDTILEYSLIDRDVALCRFFNARYCIMIKINFELPSTMKKK
jgi:hypothetical protein